MHTQFKPEDLITLRVGALSPGTLTKLGEFLATWHLLGMGGLHLVLNVADSGISCF